MDNERTRSAATGGLGALLREYRLAAGLSQEELARRCNLSARAVSDIERGRTTRPFARSLRLLADALALDLRAREKLFQAAYSHPDTARHPETAPAGSVAGGHRTIPMQLPSPAYRFVGRQAELRRLSALADQSGPGTAGQIVVISGMPGIGKTALAMHWARQAAARFPDGQLYLSLGGFAPGLRRARLSEPIRDLLDGLDVPQARVPVGTSAQAALYRSLLSCQRVLVVLDDALSAAQIRPLLPGSPGSLVLVTSRRQLTGLNATEGALLMRLEVPSYADARLLFEKRVGRDGTASGQQAVRTIIRLCARLPLALSIAAARTAAIPGPRATAFAAVATELGERSHGLDVLNCGEPATDLRSVFSTSYRNLSPAAAGLFRLLGSHPGPAISAPAAASMADLPQREACRALEELTQANLLAEHPAGRYHFHDLLRAYAAEKGRARDHKAESEAAVARLLDHYLHTAHDAALAITNTRDPLTLGPPAAGVCPEKVLSPLEALDWFAAEHAVLLAAARLAAASGLDAYAWQIPWSLGAYLDFRGRWDTWVAAQRLAVAAAMRLADVTAQALAHSGLGTAYLKLGRHARARAQLECAARFFRQADNIAGLAMNHLHLAYVCDQKHEYRAALDHAERALDLCGAEGHRAGQAKGLNAAAWYRAQLGEHDSALEYGQRALECFRVLGDPLNEAAALDTVGYIRQQVGEPLEATLCFQRAAELFQRVGDRHDEASVLAHLGAAEQDAGHPSAASTAFRRALRIFDDLRAPQADALRARLGVLESSGESC